VCSSDLASKKHDVALYHDYVSTSRTNIIIHLNQTTARSIATGYKLR